MNDARPRSQRADRLRLSVAASYTSQFYSAALGILLVPTYLRFLGAEAYGLVSFYALLQVWFQFLDAGLSGTLMRETSRFRGGAASAADLRAIFAALQRVFSIVAVLVGLALVTSSDLVAMHWLRVETLPISTASQSVALMGFALPLRWLSGLYRGVIAGFERQVWLAGFNIATTTVRFALVVPMFMFVSSSVLAFFWFQLVASVIEIGVVGWMARRQLPHPPSGTRLLDWHTALRKTASFSMFMSLATIAWLAITQTDKLLLSAALPLSSYGHFNLASALAGVIGMLGGPIAQGVQPRLTRLVAEGAQTDALALYRRATQWVCVATAPAAFTLAMFAQQALMAWTGDASLAQDMAPVVGLYAAGNGVLALASMPYYLQNAQGKLRLHAIGTGMLASLLIPAMVLAIRGKGAVGAGWVWFGAMSSYMLIWTAVAHRRFAPGLHWRWMLRDIGVVALPGAAVVCLTATLVQWPGSRLGIGIVGAIVYVTAALASAAASPSLRSLAYAAVRPKL